MLRYFFSGHVLSTHQSYSGTEDFHTVPEIHEILKKVTDQIGCKESELQLNSVSFLGEVPNEEEKCSNAGCLNHRSTANGLCDPCSAMLFKKPSNDALIQKTKELENIKADLRILHNTLSDILPISMIQKMIKKILKEDPDSRQSKNSLFENNQK